MKGFIALMLFLGIALVVVNYSPHAVKVDNQAYSMDTGHMTLAPFTMNGIEIAAVPSIDDGIDEIAQEITFPPVKEQTFPYTINRPDDVPDIGIERDISISINSDVITERAIGYQPLKTIYHNKNDTSFEAVFRGLINEKNSL